ncbi:MAG: alpha-amylase [Chloroflexi bacterium]|nr:alpha-amylase [Chloroflexota bacterium]
MKTPTRISWRLLVGSLLLLTLFNFVAWAAPTSVTLVGDLQSELGCPGDWDPACAATHLTEFGNDVWRGEFTVPMGNWQYKNALNDTWDESYPAANKPLNVGAATAVRFYFDDKTKAVVDSVNDEIPVAVGSFQDELGCPGDWLADCVNTLLTDADGDGVYSFVTTDIPAGAYEFKVAMDEDWAVSYPGANVPFAVPTNGDQVAITWDSATTDVTVDVTTAGPSYSVALVGSLQTEIGCAGDWDPACAASELHFDAEDDVWQAVWNVPAGNYEFKVALNDTWDESYGANAQPGGANIPLNLGAAVDVKFYYDHKSHWITDSVNSTIATVAGSFQSQLGCAGDWQPWCLRSWMQDIDNDGVYHFATDQIAPGGYEFKVAMDEDWAVSYPPGANVPFTVNTTGELVTFTYDSATNDVTVQVGSSASHDDDIWWNDLGHDSRDTLYRAPYGPVTTGTAVTLRMRAASGDLTAAQARLWNDRPNTEQYLDMTLVGDDGTYEWWEADIPVSAEPTIYWYRFIAIDGAATAYYEDDHARDHGWGQTYGDSQDNSWQLTVYDPAFQTPDWVKNGVMYQIFPDRFRDGDPANNTPAGTFFYNENPTIERSNDINGYWNAVICDPRNSVSDCPSIYSQNFYGGDLQGVLDKLQYLDDLGVTVIYFNPIFESPSNHKYDTADYSLIDDNFGDLALFQTLVDEAHARDMKVVLDGVFNHTSSDSVYFDRYGNYADIGACESETSVYRDWYYFTDVAPGTGPCAGSDGTPGGATYESWFGFDSLPKLQAHNPDVRALIWDSPDSIVNQWLATGVDGWRFDVGGDVDPGVTNDPTNDYWEGFRASVRASYPDTYMVIEEWGNASPWLLGNEMDATMNYQYSSAMLSFWRDTVFTDNDHNAGSSAGELTPLTPSQLDARLHNWEERYPPEAYYAMMNLLGSHDTNRPLFFLDHNAADANDDTLLEDPNYDWSDAITRQKGVVLLQMTLPGAPTIYYGDEVGLVGPTYYHGGKWEDDPYNRIPYPWLDESGTPFYTHLQTQAGQDDLLNHYRALTGLRHAHPALRTGSFQTLLVDDANNVYAYARITADYGDAAIVIVNRAGTAQDVTLDVAGALPAGIEFEDALNGGLLTVDGAGMLTVTAVPLMSGSVLVPTGAMTPPPAAVMDLAVVDVRSDEIDLAWSAAGADSYDVYRSQFSGGGYELIANTAANSLTDTGLATAVTYYYVVVSRDDITLLNSAYSNEAAATPAYAIGWANLQWPPSINHAISAVNPTENIYGQIWIDGVTGNPGATPGLLAQVGFGAVGSTPDDSWVWSDMAFNADAGNNDEYAGNLLPDILGTYCYTTRYSGDGGDSWFYAANGPDESNPTCPGPFGVLTVVPGADTVAPTAPTNLALTGTTNSSVSLSWDAHPNADGDLFGFEVYRENVAAPGFARIATIANPAATAYVDTAVITGETYNYTIIAFDDSYNRSAASNTIQATAEPRFVAVTFLVGVPDYTPGTVFLVGDIPELGPWNPGLVPMTQVNATTWSYTLDILDGTQMLYKHTRGSWDMVESWGSITGLNNRSLTVSYGTDGTQLVDNTAIDWGTGPDDEKAVQFWRDPIVVSHNPADGAIDVARDTLIEVVWSIPMEPGTTFEVEGPAGPVAGTFAYDDVSQTATFTPDADLAPGATHTITVLGAVSIGVPGGDTGVQQTPVVFSFTTITIIGEIEDLIDDVNALQDAGELNQGQANSLIVKLKGAIAKLEQGKNTPAINKLNAFINHVNDLVDDGVLSPEAGQYLIDTATDIIGQID